MGRLMTLAIALALTSCGAAPDKPLLANAPRPDQGAVAGVAAAAAAAITLSDADAAAHRPEKRQEVEKKPITVKENVPAGVLDRLDQAPPAGSASKDPERQPGDTTEPPAAREPIDYSQLKNPLAPPPPLPKD